MRRRQKDKIREGKKGDEYECGMRQDERRKPRKRDEEGTERLSRRLIVSENPSSRSFCFRFYFLPSNPPVHCLPFVHTVPRASLIPASRDFYLVTLQAFLSPISLSSRVMPFSHCSASSLLRFHPRKLASSSVSLLSLPSLDKKPASLTLINHG